MATAQRTSPKSGLTTFILCLFLGGFGIHRFYVGKIGTGILMLITFGGLGFWTIYDLFSIVCKTFTDKKGRSIEILKNPKAPRVITITVVVIFIVIFGLTFIFTGAILSGIGNTGKDELAALRQGKIEEAYSYTSTPFQNTVNLATFKKFVSQFPQWRDSVDSTFTDIEYKNDYATINGTLDMKDGSAVPMQMVLIKEDGKWKINAINIEIKNPLMHNPPVVKKAAE